MIGSRVKTRRLSGYGSTGAFNLCSPTTATSTPRNCGMRAEGSTYKAEEEEEEEEGGGSGR
jgi:hypothetical protein